MDVSFISAQEFDTSRQRMALDGSWQFASDPADRGMREGWFRNESKLIDKITMPGCAESRLPSQREQNCPRDFTDPELNRGTILRHPARHPTWYKRSFMTPDAWQGKNVWLHVGGVKPAADIWLNGRHLGRTLSSRTPVRCELTPYIRYGSMNDLVVRVDWEQGCLHGLYDMFANWSGLYRHVWVEAMSPLYLTDIHVIPAICPTGADVQVIVNRAAYDMSKVRRRGDCRIRVTIRAVQGRGIYQAEAPVRMRAGEGYARLSIPMPAGRLWSPASPHLYRAEAVLLCDGAIVDSGFVRFGLREIRVQGFQVLLNNQPVFLRGGCDDQHYPETVCPPADKDFYLRRLRLMRKWGFNYTKSCVEIFPKEYLDAADEAGLLVCEEMPFVLRDRIEKSPDCVPGADAMRRELTNIVTSDRNHPCVIIYSMFSELKTTKYAAYFHFCSQELPAMARKLNPAALVIDVTGISSLPWQGHEAVPVSTQHGQRNTDLDGSWLRWCRTCRPLAGPIPGLGTVTKPFIFHEFAWIAALSDPGLIRRYAGLPCKPLHIPEMVAASRENGQGRLLRKMVVASRKLKYALRKQALELARKEPKAAGYHHWLVHDFPQCAEGVFNDFWEEPHDISAAEFRQSNDDTVLLLEHGGRWSYRWGEQLPLAVIVSHFASKPLINCTLHWSIGAGSRCLAAGEMSILNLQPGALITLKLPGIDLPGATHPARLTMKAVLNAKGSSLASNCWHLWAFPECHGQPPGKNVIVTDRLLHDDKIAQIEAGARVLYVCPNPLYPPDGDLPRAPCNPADRTVPYITGSAALYRSVPYNTGTIGNTGTLINPHPALGEFPHEGWCDFAWAPMIDGALPLALDSYGVRINPIIRSIGHMRTMHDKAYLFELGVGRGRLLAASLKLNKETGTDPAADYLRYCLLRYMAGSLTPRPAQVTGAKLRSQIKQHAGRDEVAGQEVRAGLI